jgi:hypothetical protein
MRRRATKQGGAFGSGGGSSFNWRRSELGVEPFTRTGCSRGREATHPRAVRGLVQAVLLAVAVLVAGCAAMPLASQPPVGQPAPTVNPVFLQEERLVEATPKAAVSGSPSRTQILHALLDEQSPEATSRPVQKVVDVPIFDEQLSSDWSTEHSSGMSFFIGTERAHMSNVGIKVTPQKDFGMLFFTVKQDARETYGLDRVLGVSVWFNSGDQPLDPNNLSVTVVGSNDYTYWVPGDTSVATDSTHFFSESRLYYLGINNTVPPHTWVEAVVRLDRLPYEPDYKYVTGIYIKNDEWFRRTFYVDRINLLIVE